MSKRSIKEILKGWDKKIPIPGKYKESIRLHLRNNLMTIGIRLSLALSSLIAIQFLLNSFPNINSIEFRAGFIINILTALILFLSSGQLETYTYNLIRMIFHSFLLFEVLVVITLVACFGSVFNFSLWPLWKIFHIQIGLYWTCIFYFEIRNKHFMEEIPPALPQEEYDNLYQNREDDPIISEQYKTMSDLNMKYLELAVKLLSFYLVATGAVLSFIILHTDLALSKYVLLLPIIFGMILMIIFIISVDYADFTNDELSRLSDALALRTYPTYDVLIAFLYGSSFLFAAITGFNAYLYYCLGHSINLFSGSANLSAF